MRQETEMSKFEFIKQRFESGRIMKEDELLPWEEKFTQGTISKTFDFVKNLKYCLFYSC